MAKPKFKNSSGNAVLDQFELDHRERLFVTSYVELWNATEAARRAGYGPKGARQIGYRKLKQVHIADAVAALRDAITGEAMVRTEDVTRMWWGIANASPADIVQNRRIACRYCHGTDNEYQWRTVREHREERDRALWAAYPKAEDRQIALAMIEAEQWHEIAPDVPRPLGGFGYRDDLAPSETCPECAGQGILTTFVEDTRKLSDATLMLFDGVKETQHGVEVKMQDRAKALENVAKQLGMFSKHEDINPLASLAQAITQAAQTIPVAPESARAVGFDLGGHDRTVHRTVDAKGNVIDEQEIEP